jgi:NADPH:quinone reductase-like Zn-dependent oxidoreductase
MKAAQYNRYGGPEVIEINNNASNPTSGKGQVLVEVHAASLNPFDFKLRLGYMKDMIPLKFPFTIGGDFSGVVTQLGENVSEFKIGDEVYGQALVLNGGSGAIAEFATSNVGNCAVAPKSIDFLESASLPLVGASAIQALEDHIKLKSGDKILIHGGAGGIGHIAVQLAKYLGASVATTVGSENIEFVKSLGADEVIDYKTQKFEDRLHDFDAVFDTVGGETLDRSFKALKKGGVIVSMLGVPSPDLAKQYGVTAIGQNTKITSTRLNRLTDLVDNGAIKAHIDKVFSLEKTREAFEYLQKGHPRGKVVVRLKG